MNGMYHLSISSMDGVLFRSEEDYRRGYNCLGLSMFKTNTLLYSDSFMSNHLHLSVVSGDAYGFINNFSMRYKKYFNNKYHRQGSNKWSVHIVKIEGINHILTAWSYIFRNGLHHGESSTAFDYAYSSVNSIFMKELGKKEEKIITNRSEIASYLPRYSEFPDTYQMNENGMFTHSSLTQVKEVEMQYLTPRSFLYYMNRLSTEEWRKEQNKDNNGKDPITIELIEHNMINEPISKLLSNEYGRKNNSHKSDLEVCNLIDNIYIPKYRKTSIYDLSKNEKQQIFNELFNDHHIYKEQIHRCL